MTLNSCVVSSPHSRTHSTVVQGRCHRCQSEFAALFPPFSLFPPGTPYRLAMLLQVGRRLGEGGVSCNERLNGVSSQGAALSLQILRELRQTEGREVGRGEKQK